MGFKIAVLLVPLNENSLAQVVSGVYGKRAHLEPCDEIVEMLSILMTKIGLSPVKKVETHGFLTGRLYQQ